ncbi:helix-turn-helix domain-containing protein [Natrarchaeobius oligotrophus]|uniref:Uncharacterized protein n=1 Tax=Natrarchaeobius chitinivorans TaxID=1679083 RepID=A0A3N6MEX3_NATCH|nr:helix-turn-helix domain-containing protein [Natrarchaeobius chitinivorans]RQH02469.1 hypothetical protein EA472_03975 [Natrarchaeobius chitinivorans]
MTLYEATFRVAHESAYAELTRGRGLRLDMWCNDHCDMIRAAGTDTDVLVDRLESLVGIRDMYRGDDRLLLITDDCLRSHQEPLIETYLSEHGCLLWPPQRYEHGQLLVRVLALTETSLSELYQQLVEEFPVTVESKLHRTHDVLDDIVDHSHSVTAGLTDRQMEALVAAHEHGFYEIPRENTSEEVAETLDLSRRTFEEHLRRAEGKVIGEILEERL